MRDIQTRDDLSILLWAFYTKLLTDPAISYIFTDVAKIHLESHMPSLTDFWEQTLLERNGYRKNVLEIHMHLNALEPLTDAYFEIWLRHFNATIDTLFAGETAEKAKIRALSIATIMKIKLHTTL